MNVLLITLDSFMFESLGAFEKNGAANLGHLFSKGRLFTDCVPSATLTAPAHASIMTGLSPESHKVFTNGDVLRSRTLAEILKEDGYETAAAVGVWSLGSSKGFARGFSVYHNYSAADPVLQVMAKNKMSKMLLVNTALKATKVVKKMLKMDKEKADRSTDRVMKFFSGKSKSDFFCWLHYFDLHTNSVAEYWDGARKIDRNIGKLLKRFRDLGVYDDTLIVITADHSIVFKDGKGTCVDISQVPLLFYNRKMEPAVSGEKVRNMDVMPTILGLLGKNVPAVEGKVILRWK